MPLLNNSEYSPLPMFMKSKGKLTISCERRSRAKESYQLVVSSNLAHLFVNLLFAQYYFRDTIFNLFRSFRSFGRMSRSSMIMCSKYYSHYGLYLVLHSVVWIESEEHWLVVQYTLDLIVLFLFSYCTRRPTYNIPSFGLSTVWLWVLSRPPLPGMNV